MELVFDSHDNYADVGHEKDVRTGSLPTRDSLGPCPPFTLRRPCSMRPNFTYLLKERMTGTPNDTQDPVTVRDPHRNGVVVVRCPVKLFQELFSVSLLVV